MILTTRYDDDEYRVMITAYRALGEGELPIEANDNLTLQLMHKAREEKLTERDGV